MMDNSKIEKAKEFVSKIPTMRRALKPSNGGKVVTSRIPMMRRAVKPSNELAGKKEIAKAEDAKKCSTKRSALIETGRRLTQAASQSENRKTASVSDNTDTRQLTYTVFQNGNTKTSDSSLSNRRCTNISTKTVIKRPVAKSVIRNTDRRLTNAAVHINKKVTESSLGNRRCTNIFTKTVRKKPTEGSTNENKKVNENKNQNNNKSSSIECSNINRHLTNVSDSKLKELACSNKNIVNRRLTNFSKIETKRPMDIGMQNRRQAIRANQQTTRCNNQETKIEKFQENLFVECMQDIVKPCKDSKFNQGSSSSIQGQQKTSVQANDDMNLNHFSQPNIEFVADEKYRDQILSGKGVSPIRKPLNKVKCSSIYERQSLFKSSQTPFDIKTALKKLEDEGRRISMMKINQPDLSSPSKYERQSLFKSFQTPFDINAAIKRLEEEGRRISVMKMSAVSSSQLTIKNQQPSILKAVENVDPASENCRAFAIKRNPQFVASPRLERDHIQQRSASETVLKRLEELQLKKRVKSSKKVTFNLGTSGSSAKELKPDPFKTRDLKNQPPDNNNENYCLTSKLVPINKTPISEPHSSTQSTDKVKRDVTTSHYNAMLLRICGHSSTTSAQDKANFHHQERTSTQIRSDIYLDEHPPPTSLKTPAKNEFTLPSTPTLKPSTKESSVSALSPVEKISIAAYSAVSQPGEPDFQTFRRLTNSMMASSALRSSLYLSSSQAVGESGLRRNTLSRLCTPKPVSFYPRSNENNEISPEFMGRRTSCIVAIAPISTPMVLRNLAESFEETLSPVAQDTITTVCQRLDFDEIEKESDDALQDCDSSNELQKRSGQNIFGYKNIMDQLTDRECSEIFDDAAYSVIFTRKLLNPVAQILNHGDDMHFIPVKQA